MRQTMCIAALTLVGVLAVTTALRADVIVRGPFGGLIVVPSSSDVRVVPGSVVVVPAPTQIPPPPAVPLPPPAVLVPQQQPVLVRPVSPAEFARDFRPQAGTNRVMFLHSRTNQAVTVAFELPPGNPRVSYFAHSLVFDYGRHEVEIRFQIGGKVKVMQR
jgi:hypothetical protein